MESVTIKTRSSKRYKRLVIIGNGFDLSHGLKSGYSHFISDYVLKLIEFYNKNGFFKDRFISIKRKDEDNPIYQPIPNHINSLHLLAMLAEKGFIEIIYNSLLMKSIFNDQLERGWADVECIYYDTLTKIAMNPNIQRNDLAIINQDFSQLKKNFLEYLTSELEKLSFSPNQGLINQFKSKLLKDECPPPHLKEDHFIRSRDILFLNFNYTSILSQYIRLMNLSKFNLNQIHGSLESTTFYDQYDPVFGFGDEHDKKYSDLENLRGVESLEHLKSFQYLKNDNYRNLMKFIDSGEFQVHIYGHSCGITDRTMLKEIFQNRNCISIKPYYYGNKSENDFTEKTMSISRHFDDKSQMRLKVVNFEFCDPMSQIKK